MPLIDRELAGDDGGAAAVVAGRGVERLEAPIVEDRYGAGSTLITSQLPVDAWHEVIGESTLS